MQIFITGATGNAAAGLLKQLDTENNDVYCLCRKEVEIENCNVLVNDLSALEEYKDIISSSDVIIHLASPRSDEKDVVFMEDILPTKQLIDFWEKGKFIYISSQTVFGVSKSDFEYNSPYNPMCWYDYAKVVNELQLQMEEMNKDRTEKIILRIPLLFSLGPHRYDRQFLDLVYQHCKNNGRFYFKSEHDYETVGSSILSDKDCGRAIMGAINQGKSGMYNISSCFCTWKEIIDFFSESCGFENEIVFDTSDKHNLMYLPHNVAKFKFDRQREILGIEETMDAKSILEEIVSVYKKEL